MNPVGVREIERDREKEIWGEDCYKWYSIQKSNIK